MRGGAPVGVLLCWDGVGLQMVGGYGVPAIVWAVSRRICFVACLGECVKSQSCTPLSGRKHLTFPSTFPSNIPHLTLNISKRSPFAFQNESFCTPKRVLLPTKRSPFAVQKDSFWNTVVVSMLYTGVLTSFLWFIRNLEWYYILKLQTVGGYGVPAIAWASRQCILSITRMYWLTAQAMAGTP